MRHLLLGVCALTAVLYAAGGYWLALAVCATAAFLYGWSAIGERS